MNINESIHYLPVPQPAVSQPAQPTPEQLKDFNEKREKIISETSEKIKNIKLPDIRTLPIKVTRDFSNFPFPQVPLTAEEKNDIRTCHCFKFQTSYYIAYVHCLDQNYVEPIHLENPNDSLAMREARRDCWGHLSGKEDYEIRHKYPKECDLLDYEYLIISNKSVYEKKHLYGEEFCEKLKAIEKKYASHKDGWKYYSDLVPNKIIVIGTVAAAALSTFVFFYHSVIVSLICFSVVLLINIEKQTNLMTNIYKKMVEK